jgi:hypothetical protein
MLRRACVSILCLLSVIVLAVPAFIGTAAPPQAKPVAYNMYFGDLHTHTSYSDAWEGTPWDAYAAAAASGADFMAITDHATLWNAYSAFVLDEAEWADTMAAADHFTSKSFAALVGYEAWLLGECGEINVYNVKELPTASHLGYKFDRLPGFYDWIAKQGAVGQFNHPTYMTRNFMDYAYYTPSRDVGMGAIEVWNDLLTEQSYIMALDAGWHVMPTANSDTHSPDWMTGSDVRTVLLAPSLTSDELYKAISAGRGYATLDKNLRISFTVNGMVMSSMLSPSTTSYSASIHIEDPDGTASDAVTMVELVSDGGHVVWSANADSTVVDLSATISSDTAHYYYLRVSTQSGLDGAPGVTAWTSPVWTGR